MDCKVLVGVCLFYFVVNCVISFCCKGFKMKKYVIVVVVVVMVVGGVLYGVY